MKVELKDSIKKMVTDLLQKNEVYRDDDQRLYTRILYDYYDSRTNIRTMLFWDFLKDLKEGKVIHFESVRRIRQKIQEENPSLRGFLYDKRHDRTEEVREYLGYND